jgi:hypothetical protein
MDRIAQTTTPDTTTPAGLLVDFDSVLGQDRKPFHAVKTGTTVTATVTVRSVTAYGPAGHSRGIVDGDGGWAMFYLPRDYKPRLGHVLTPGAKVMLRGTATKVGDIPVIGVFAARAVNV